MIIERPERYRLKGFEVSHVKGKKYNGVLVDKTSGKEKRVPFGGKGYQQYKDRALGVYSNDDHGDDARRKRYQQRHQGEDKKKYSSGWFSWKYLW